MAAENGVGASEGTRPVFTYQNRVAGPGTHPRPPAMIPKTRRSFVSTDPTLDKFLLLLKSRKFWAAIVALIVATAGERAGLDAEAITAAVATIVAYILGTALEDGLSRRG